jgi:UDP-N-acetylmuramate--alanine ligase
LAVADVLNLPVAQAALALSEFRGTGRRFEVRGEVGGVTIIDDYAHHPTHIRAALSAARDRYPSQSIWAVWQPHTYSRTRILLEDYATAFDLADHVIITEVYPAREPLPADKFSARKVLSVMRHSDAHFVETLHKAMAILLARVQPGDVLLVLSAGDADQISDRMLIALEDDGPLPRFR